MGFIQGNRAQIDLLGYSIEDFVEKDSKTRFIVKTVETLDTSAFQVIAVPLYPEAEPQGILSIKKFGLITIAKAKINQLPKPFEKRLSL